MAIMTMPMTRKERRKAEAEALRAQRPEEAAPVVGPASEQWRDIVAQAAEARAVQVAEESKQAAADQPVYDPRLLEYSPFNDLMKPRPATAKEEKKEKPRNWFLTSKYEWQRAMYLELLRFPIMVPCWWAGMQLCEHLWKSR